MRSPQVKNVVSAAEERLYTDLMVLKSAAGYYIGTLYNNPDGYQEPGSRDSEYFPTKERADEALKNCSWYQRLEP
jgi:hypothetical protein